jgi:hypothetical protein
MDFPPGRTWRVAVPAWTDDREGRSFVDMTGYVSFAQGPNRQVHCGRDYCDPVDNWSQASGNLLDFSQIEHGRLRVTNDTCSHFFLRLVLHAGPPTRGPAAKDGGA